jgi:hypothetical protein
MYITLALRIVFWDLGSIFTLYVMRIVEGGYQRLRSGQRPHTINFPKLSTSTSSFCFCDLEVYYYTCSMPLRVVS